MKRVTLILSDAAFRVIKSEATVNALCHAGGEPLLATFAGRIVKAIESGEEELELKTRAEREKESDE